MRESRTYGSVRGGSAMSVPTAIEAYVPDIGHSYPHVQSRPSSDMRADQISKAREIAIGSDLLLAMRRYLAVDSIFVWPKSTRTASISPVPFKMWRAFVRRKDSEPYFVGSSPASITQDFTRRFICRAVIGRGRPAPRPGKI